MNANGQLDKPGWIHSALDQFEADLLRYSRNIVGDLDRARDVVQDTFLALCRQDPASLNGGLAPWLYRVCRNRSLDVRRKEKRMTSAVDATVIDRPGEGDSPADVVEHKDAAASAAKLVDELPENQREVILLKFQGGLTYRQIAEVTGLSTGNVGFLIHSGLKRLRARMHSSAG